MLQSNCDNKIRTFLVANRVSYYIYCIEQRESEKIVRIKISVRVRSGLEWCIRPAIVSQSLSTLPSSSYQSQYFIRPPLPQSGHTMLHEHTWVQARIISNKLFAPHNWCIMRWSCQVSHLQNLKLFASKTNNLKLCSDFWHHWSSSWIFSWRITRWLLTSDICTL